MLPQLLRVHQRRVLLKGPLRSGAGLLLSRPTLFCSSSSSSTSSLLTSYCRPRQRLFSSAATTTTAAAAAQSSPSSPIDILSDLIITKACTRRIKQLQTSAKNDALALRIAVESGGCSGFQYTFKMEDPSTTVTPEDRLFERDGTKVIVDEGSLDLIRGATLDFEQELIRSSFAIVNNPKAESACGCGSSFAIKSFAANKE